MKRNSTLFFSFLLLLALSISSCQAIGDIFKAGFWGGLIVAAVVVGIIIWLISKARK